MSKKSIVTTVLAGTLLLSTVLSACGSSGNEPKNASSPPASSSAPTGESSASAGVAGTAGKYDPPIELTTATFNFSYPKFDKGDDINNNPWSRYMLDEFGIKVNTLWDVAFEQYEQKVNLTIASQDLPDFLAVTPLQFKQLYDSGKIADLTDVYAQHATEDVKKLIADAGAEVLESAKIDGKLMAVPWTGEAKVGVPVLWIREDWFSKLGLQAPKTMADVLAIADAFTTQDPDGNSKADTYGLALDKDFELLNGFLNGYHAYKNIWVDDGNGGLAYSSIQPEMKSALASLQELFKNKRIDPEFGVKDIAAVNQSIGGGKVGMVFGHIGTAQQLQPVTPDTNWLPFPVPSVDDQPALLQHPLNIFLYYWIVNKDTKNPEAIFTMLQAWVDLFYKNTSDELYAKYNAVTGTGYWMSAPIKIYNTFNDIDAYRHIKPFLEAKDKSNQDLTTLTPMERGWYKELLEFEKGNMEFRGRNAKSGLNSASAVIDGYIQKDQYKPDLFTTTPTPAMVQKKAILDKMELQMISKIILGGSLDEFDKFVAEWKKLGGDDITNEVNEWYKNR